MDEIDIRKQVEDILQGVYKLGMSHAAGNRLSESWVDKKEQLLQLVAPYSEEQVEKLSRDILVTLEGLSSSLPLTESLEVKGIDALQLQSIKRRAIRETVEHCINRIKEILTSKGVDLNDNH